MPITALAGVCNFRFVGCDSELRRSCFIFRSSTRLSATSPRSILTCKWRTRETFSHTFGSVVIQIKDLLGVFSFVEFIGALRCFASLAAPKAKWRLRIDLLWAFDAFYASKPPFPHHHLKKITFSPYDSNLLSVRGRYRHQAPGARALVSFNMDTEPRFHLMVQCFCSVSEPADVLHSFMKPAPTPQRVVGAFNRCDQIIVSPVQHSSFWPFLFPIRLTKEVKITSNSWGHRPPDDHMNGTRELLGSLQSCVHSYAIK